MAKRGVRLDRTYVQDRADFLTLLDRVQEVLDATDAMYPVKWESVRIEFVEGAVKVSAETQDPDIPGIMEVEPVIQIHAAPISPNVIGGSTSATPRGTGASTLPSGWPEVLP